MATRFPTPVSQDIAAFRRAFDPFFSDVFAPAASRSRGAQYRAAATALPLDVYAREDDVVVVAAAPGIDPAAIEITVEKNTVTLAGKAAATSPDAASTATTWYLQELPRGSFSRTLTLPFEVDAARADATFDNGLLRLTLPKRESAKAHQIRVKVASTDAEAAAPVQVEATASSVAEPTATDQDAGEA
ncbi:MAG: Hsp20/alpha crystallin family protein [Thermomicrobiales bacterium]